MIVIDGYNVLYSTMPPMLAGLDEAGLCGALSRSGLAGAYGGAVVVCDGGVKPGGVKPGGGWPSAWSGVELVYSGPSRSADDVIVARIDRDSSPKRRVVVTSDRTIQKHVRRRRATVMSSAAFIRMLAEALRGGGFGKPSGGGTIDSGNSGDGVGGVRGKRPRSGAGGGGLHPLETERWLAEFGFVADDSPDESGDSEADTQGGVGGAGEGVDSRELDKPSDPEIDQERPELDEGFVEGDEKYWPPF